MSRARARARGGHYSLGGTLFTSELCPAGHYSRGNTIHSHTGTAHYCDEQQLSC